MSEEQGKYVVEEMPSVEYDNAAEIHPPKTIRALQDKGLTEYKVWGWVKISANFINHIKKLKGAKLAIWQVVALSIDENGACNLSIQEIADLSGYSYSETHESLKELDGMEYLSIGKEKGRKSMYSPSFAARGANQPTENPSLFWRGTSDLPLQPTGGHPSSPSIQNAHPSIKELKELRERDESQIFTALESLTGSLNSNTPKFVDTWLEKHTCEWILKAIEIAKGNGARSVKYIDEVLISWEANGYPKTREEKVNQRKAKGKSNGQQSNSKEQYKVSDEQPSESDLSLAAEILRKRNAEVC